MLGGRETVWGGGGGRNLADRRWRSGALYLLTDFMVQLRYALVGPILSQCGQNMTKSIRSK